MARDRTIEVALFQRRPLPGISFSVETYFDLVASAAPTDIRYGRVRCHFVGTGVWRRLADMLLATVRQGEVNHIAGDVHYLSYLLRRDRTVLTVLDCVFLEQYTGLRRALVKLLYLTIPEKRVAAITAISGFTRKQIIDYTGCDPDKVRVVYVCVSEKFVRIDRPFNASYPTILHVGTADNKNLAGLVEALRSVPCRLRVVGRLRAGQTELLQRSGLEYENLHDLDDAGLMQAYATADILAFVSTYEGFGMPIVEANVVGRPVVTSNVASMPEVAGEAACFVDPFDPLSIRRGILRVIQDERYRNELVTRGFENALRFRADRIAEQYAAIYRELVG